MLQSPAVSIPMPAILMHDIIQADCSCQGEMIDGEVVPTVSEWGLIILALLLLNIAVLGIRQTEIRLEET